MTNKLTYITRYTIFALLIFTPLARGAVQGWAVTVIHMATLVALAAFLLEKNLTQSWNWINTPLDKPILILITLSILSACFSLHRYTSFWSTILLFNYLTIYYLIIHTFRTRPQIHQLVYLIVGVAAFLSIFGLLKTSGNNPFPWWTYPEITQNVDRLASTYGNANHLAGYMEMAIPLLLGLMLAGPRGVRLFLLICITLLLFLSLMLSLSRGGWIGMLSGLLFMAATLSFDNPVVKKRLVMIVVVGAFASAVFVLSSTPTVKRILDLQQKAGLEARMAVWGGVVDMIQDHPMFGAGPGTFATVYTQYQPPGLNRRYFAAHNDYLQLVSEAGLPVIAIMLWMIVVLYRKGFKKIKNPSRLVRGVTLGAMSGITAILVHSVSDFNLHIPANAILFTVLAALVTAPIPEQN
ncbi:O-antigen ligase family protein [Thermodesulfobacteriota bacterium]